MITVFTLNGKLTLTLGGVTDLETSMLLELCKGPVEIQSHPTLQIGDKQIPNAVTITPAAPKPVTETNTDMK